LANINTNKNIKDSPGRKIKKRLNRLCFWLLFDLTLAGIILLLLLQVPSAFRQPLARDSKVISPYLTNYLMPTIYSGAQKQKPFTIQVLQEGINDIIARNKWPIQTEGIVLNMPQTTFVDGKIILMGAVFLKGAQLVITVEAKPAIDQGGLLNFNITGLRVGVMNIKVLAKFIAAKMYKKRLAEYNIDTNTTEAKIAASLLNDIPFDPVFKIEDKYIRIKKIELTKGKLNINFVPAPTKK
jgi:hypothetical protein